MIPGFLAPQQFAVARLTLYTTPSDRPRRPLFSPSGAERIMQFQASMQQMVTLHQTMAPNLAANYETIQHACVCFFSRLEIVAFLRGRLISSKRLHSLTHPLFFPDACVDAGGADVD